MDSRPFRARAAAAARAAISLPHGCNRLANDDTIFSHDLIALTSYLRSYARYLSRDEHMADDLVQETMARAWRARRSFCPGTNMKAWTFKILRNHFLYQQHRERFVGDYDELAAERMLARPEEQSQAVDLKDVCGGFALLPEDQRNALHMIAVEGLAYDAAATIVGVPVGTLKSRVSRARITLRNILSGGARPSAEPRQTRETTSEASPKNMWALAKAAGKPLWIG